MVSRILKRKYFIAPIIKKRPQELPDRFIIIKNENSMGHRITPLKKNRVSAKNKNIHSPAQGQERSNSGTDRESKFSISQPN